MRSSEFGWHPVIEVAKRLGVQPVRVGSITFQGWPPVFQFHFGSDGLAFGKPGAINQPHRRSPITFA